jgi:hypothetical protein
MDKANFYWTILVALVSAGWVLTGIIRDRIAQSVALSGALSARLLEYERINLENPDIQKFLSQNAGQEEAYFHSDERLREDIFYKAKALVYMHLNLFDEILSMPSNRSRIGFLIEPAPVVEKSDWLEYMKERLRHPFYRSILNHEMHTFGTSFRDFWAKNRAAVESKPASRFIW